MYGNLINRLEEDRAFTDEIKVGTGMTEYFWSDRHAYEVTKVIDQKHVHVREYDHECAGGYFSNEWKMISNPDNPERYITKRGKYWYWTSTLTREQLSRVKDRDDLLRLIVAGFDLEIVREKGKQTKYSRAKVSFGVASYYYDYEF